MHLFLNREYVIELLFSQQAALMYHFAYALTGFGTDLTDNVTLMVANVWVLVSHDTDRVKHEVFTDFFVDCDAINALVA